MWIVDRNRRFPPYLTGALLLLCIACPQSFDEIRVVEVGDRTVFEMPRITAGLEADGAFELLDLTVRRSDCSSDCTVWSLVRADSLVGAANLRTARLDYGTAPPGMEQRRPAAALEPGTYTISATVQRYDAAGSFIESLSMHGSFTARGADPGEPRGGEPSSTASRRVGSVRRNIVSQMEV